MAVNVSDDMTIPNHGFRGTPARHYGMGPSRSHRGMDPDTKRLLIYAAGVAFVLLGLIGAAMLTGGKQQAGVVTRGGVPVVEADPRPIREKPLNPGGMKVDGADNDVFSGGGDTQNARLAAPAEEPDTKALRAEAHIVPAIEKPKPAATPLIADSPKPAAVAQSPAQPPAIQPPAAEPAKPVAAAQPAPPKAQPVASAPPAPAKTEAKPAGHSGVQLASVETEDAAKSEWQRLSHRFPDMLHGHQPAYTRVEKDGKVWWRVRTAGFADTAAARTFCDQMKLKGGGCSVAEF
jgi:hypothetical protein